MHRAVFFARAKDIGSGWIFILNTCIRPLLWPEDFVGIYNVYIIIYVCFYMFLQYYITTSLLTYMYIYIYIVNSLFMFLWNCFASHLSVPFTIPCTEPAFAAGSHSTAVGESVRANGRPWPWDQPLRTGHVWIYHQISWPQQPTTSIGQSH